MATPSASDMGQFFDFAEAAMPDRPGGPDQEFTSTQPIESQSINQNPEGLQRVGEEFNTDFSSWLPRYQKPAHPCDYCRSKGLECFIFDSDGSGHARCSPCSALFRPCSFIDQDKMPAIKQRTALDTLDVVGEDEARRFGLLTGRKQMRSKGHIGPIEDETNGEERPKTGAAAARFPRAAVKVLKDWMLQHIDHPYPTDEEKEQLKQQTGLSIGQISGWMANTRRRQKARPKRSASPSIRPSTDAINIPVGKTWETMNPLERWKHSPPENEPAPLNAIAQAIDTFDPPETLSGSSSYRKDASNESSTSFSVFKAPSITSLETGLTNMSSGSLGSHNSAYSYGSRHSLCSVNSLKSKERRRRRRLPTRTPKADLEEGPRPFQCTFCTDRFKAKYDWSRHEKSLHLSLEKWICAPLGEIITDKVTGKPKCVYCDALEPSEEHLASHGHNACCEKGRDARTFYRKDHLRQHLRLMHGCKMTSSMDTWKSEAQFIKSRCGFCDMKFDKWQDRIDHLAKEFRNGANMKDWKGCRGLDAHVAIHVTNAMPPYLIANESKSPFPFSASNVSSLKQTSLQLESKDLEYILPSNLDISCSNDLSAQQGASAPASVESMVISTPTTYSASVSPQANPNATCWEILTVRLGRFARQRIEKHGAESITDAMLQDEARLILYGTSDGWEQTAADSPEWLNLFKQAHGIKDKGSAQSLALHDVFEDLGLHPNTLVDPTFSLDNFKSVDLPSEHSDRGMAFELARATTILQHARRLSSGQRFPRSLSVSQASPLSREPMKITEEHLGVPTEISELVCTSAGGPCYGENGEPGYTVHDSKSTCSKKKRYWSNPNPVSLASFATQCTSAGKPVHECAKVGLRSFSPINEQDCPTQDNALIYTIPGRPCAENNDTMAATEDFQFPSFDQEFQKPSSNAAFPISATDMNTTGSDSTANESYPWDNEEMNFAMDIDMDIDFDLDMDLNMLGKR